MIPAIYNMPSDDSITRPQLSLTEAERRQFLQYGYVHLTNCFTPEQAAEVTEGVWARLGMSPSDKSTWTKPRVNMPAHREFDCSIFAPKAWAAICELCGGEARITPDSRKWGDSFIVNLGASECEGKPIPPKDLDNWHVDGDTMVHYLDSPEQGLLIIPLFSDIIKDGGGTMICPDAIPKVARRLFDHPEGVSPRMVLRDHEGFKKESPSEWINKTVQDCDEFIEATGEVGDVYLLHPLMVHSATSNALRKVRIITNPKARMKEPFCFDRQDGDYSLVELKTIQSVGGLDKLRGWHITMPRERVVPERIGLQEEMKKAELKRLGKPGGDTLLDV